MLHKSCGSFIRYFSQALKIDVRDVVDDNSTFTNENGRICMKKVMMVETTEYDTEIQCHQVDTPECFIVMHDSWKSEEV